MNASTYLVYVCRIVVAAIAPFALAGCSSGGCPTIACQPEISLTYARPLSAEYSIEAVVRGTTLQAHCPMAGTLNLPDPPPRIARCDGDSLTIMGVDLGRAENASVPVSLSFDGNPAIEATASLVRILNGRMCDQICYVHQGTAAN